MQGQVRRQREPDATERVKGYARGTKASNSAKRSTSAGRRPGSRTARGQAGRRRSRWTGRSWRPWGASARQAPVFSQKESVQVLCREDGFHRLQARGHSVAVRPGARQDSAAPANGRVRAAPALAGSGHQARAQHCVAAVCGERRGHFSAARGVARAVAWRSRASGRAFCSGCAPGASGRSAKGMRRQFLVFSS